MLSLIFPVLNEADNIPELLKRVDLVAQSAPEESFEFVFVDDGSTDDTFGLLQRARGADPRIEVISLSRNFGSHSAIRAGLQYCRGDAAVILPADLQDPPELIPKLLAEWKSGTKVVWGYREKQYQETFFNNIGGKLFYYLLHKLTNLAVPPEGSDVVLVDRALIEKLKGMQERNSSYALLISWLGYLQGGVKYAKVSRRSGMSKWTFTKKVKVFVDAILAFSFAPLRFMGAVGALLSLLGLLYGFVVVAVAIFGGPVTGWASLMTVVLVVSGFQMLMMGLLGEYIWRVYDEVRARPLFIVNTSTFGSSENLGPNAGPYPPLSDPRAR